MKLHLKRGFTLIELLVVIAIIGILASVVLASLNSARSKGADASIKSTINNVRAQGAIYYEDNSNYDGFCASLTEAQNSVNNAGGAGSWTCTTDAATLCPIRNKIGTGLRYNGLIMEWFYIFPQWYQYTVVFFLGAVIGSFLNVYIYRFHTGKSLSGRSHCLSCGARLRALELVPLLSYLGLRGRCRNCHSSITARYFFVELVTGVLFLVAYLRALSLEELLYLWAVCAVLLVITVYDIRHFIIPDSLTVALTVLAVGWRFFETYSGLLTYTELLHAMAAAGAGAGFLFFLWFISKGKWIGFGDVKLAFPLGVIVGTWQVFSMIVLSFWIGAGVSILIMVLMKLQRGKLRLRFLLPNLTMKSVVPFAPFLVSGCLVVLFTKFNVLTLFTF